MRNSQTIGERIRELRVGFGLSRDELALDIGISRNTLARYETDERKPDADFLIALQLKYEVSSDWILFGEKPHDESEFSLDELLLISLCRRHPKKMIGHLTSLLMSVSLGESEKD